MTTNRREFLKGVAISAGAGIAAGCACAKGTCGGVAGAPMRNFRCAPIRNGIRVGVVGVGARGIGAVNRLMLVPGVTVTAVCDIRPEYAEKAAQAVVAKTGVRPLVFSGTAEAYRGLCDSPTVDVVYNSTSWDAHVPVSVYAMKAGKHTAIEVPSALFVDECWELVETAETCKVHCLQLENCCYGEEEMLALNMCRLGVLGETVYGEAGYLHSGATRGFELSKFRAEWYQEHRGNYYPTHGLGPVAQYMNINRGDRFDYVNSMEGTSVGDLIRGGDVRWNGNNLEEYKKYLIGSYNSSLLHTVNGKIILLNLSCSVPHPYSRMNTIQGTHGILMDYPLRIDVEDTPGSGPHGFEEKRTAELREKYKHPMWKLVGDIAKKVGGHGGMDFIMDLRWVYCLQNGLPLDMDVYDLASWSCLCEVTEKSQAKRGAPVDVPDFTRGAWKTMKPLGIETVDMTKLDFGKVGNAGPQQTIGQSKEG